MELLKNKKSLIPSLIIPKTVSYFAKTLELISSRLASFFGIRLFITPVNFPIPKREQYMLKSAQKKRLHIPEIKKEIDSFEKENHRLPTEHEVDQIQTPSCTSLNEFINDDNDELVNIIEDKMFKSPDILEDEEEELRNQEMKRAMRNLSQREINIINGYFGIDGEPMTLEMIGEEVGLTKERVRQIKESAIRKVRNNLGGIFDI